MNLPPAVGFEGGEVGRGRAVEGQLLAGGVLDPFEFFFLVGGDHQGGADDFEVVDPASALVEPPLQGGKGVGQQGVPAVEGVSDEAVGGLSRDFGHQRPEAAGEDGRRSEGVRAGVEGRNHQGVAVELAAKIEFGLALPAIEDRLDGEDDFAHARGGLRPGHAEAVHDVGPDLGAEPQEEAAPGDVLGAVGEVREVHGVAGEGDGDGRPQAQVLRVFRSHGQGQKGIVLGLEAEGAVVTDFLEMRIKGAGVPGIFEGGGGVDLHEILRDTEDSMFRAAASGGPAEGQRGCKARSLAASSSAARATLGEEKRVPDRGPSVFPGANAGFDPGAQEPVARRAGQSFRMPLDTDLECPVDSFDGFDDAVRGPGASPHPRSDLGDGLVVQAVDFGVGGSEQRRQARVRIRVDAVATIGFGESVVIGPGQVHGDVVMESPAALEGH